MHFITNRRTPQIFGFQIQILSSTFYRILWIGVPQRDKADDPSFKLPDPVRTDRLVMIHESRTSSCDDQKQLNSASSH
ncbi:unnamed protein product [Chironomus riparius]|uniref:Uncharacterized protein n=1 Tax=Chironomus riparius TaxID=315576 RepID=A0A9N9RN20_9DIPT|nr:unnamed protein product [Chironomus riparius]